MRARTTWVVAFAVVLLAAGCGGDGEEGESPSPTGATGTTPEATATTPEATATATAGQTYNIWYVNPLPNTPDWGRSGQLFEDAAADIGYEATVVGPDAIDIPAMISQIEQAIADDADGIITCPLDPAAFADVINRAQDAGIVVVSIGCVDDNADFSIGTDNDTYGRTSADLINEQTGGEAGVGIIGTDQTTPNQVAQVEAFRDQIASMYPGIQELVWESDNSDAGVAAQKIPAMIAAYPEMNYLWIIEGAAPGAVPAGFQEAGVDPGEIQVLAIDAQDSTLQAIEDGWITATLNQCWFNASPDAARRIIATLNGEEQPSFIPIDVDPVAAEDLPYEGCPVL